MKVGILGCGAMAETFADTLRQMEETECYAAASRTLKRAEEFAREYGFEKAYGSYEKLCEDPEVELYCNTSFLSFRQYGTVYPA